MTQRLPKRIGRGAGVQLAQGTNPVVPHQLIRMVE